MPPFDRAHTTSYSTLIETVRLSFTVVKSRLLTPNLHLVPPQGVTLVEFRRDLWRQKTSPWAIVWCYLCDPTFSRFSSTPTCDGRTHG